MSDKHPLHGETVQVISLACATRGYYTEYDATIMHDGTLIQVKPRFKEDVARLFRQAGHTQVRYERGHNISMAHVDVVIEDVNNRYQIVAVLGIDGTTWHKASDEVERPKPRTAAEIKAEFDAKYAKNTPPKVVEKPVDRFAHGMTHHVWARVNPYSLEMQDGEFILVIDRVKKEAQEQAEETARAA